MSRVYKTARGRVLDMDKVKLANESVTAIGNMKINARGDKLGPGGKIEAGRNQIMDRVYATSTGGGYSPNDPETFKEKQETMENTKAKELAELANNLVQSTTDKSEEQPKESTTAARGNLASAVAKTATVTQEPIPDPRKPNGPTRI